jgi:ATP-binding cassette subfamily B protein
MMLLLTNLSLAVVLYLGGRQTIYSVISPGDFVAFIAYLGLLTWPMMALGWVTNLVQRGRASLDRLNRILETEPVIKDGPAPLFLSRPRGRVVFDAVDFSYESGGVAVLKSVGCCVRPGETLGIVGPPGSGKTTLLSLLPRLYDVNRGRILIDGKDIRAIGLQDLRSNISFVSQEPFLFAGSIRDNITLGDSRTTDDKLETVARKASLYDTIVSFTDGFDTVVGEKGIVLSGGQKQRIALARALLKEAAFLVLDDPVSQVDAETAADIIGTLKTVAGTCTIFIVSHRISAVRFADTIIALDDGRIVASGAHSTLLASSDYYAKTFGLQQIEEEFSAL